jgi:hypothetical protein
MTNKAMTEEKKKEIALAKARDFKDGIPNPFLAQMEWEEHLLKVQQILNRRTVLLSVIISSILGMSGVVGGVFLKDHLEKSKIQNRQEISQFMGIENPALIPPTKLHETSTINKSSSSKPPKDEHGQKR